MRQDAVLHCCKGYEALDKALPGALHEALPRALHEALPRALPRALYEALPKALHKVLRGKATVKRLYGREALRRVDLYGN